MKQSVYLRVLQLGKIYVCRVREMSLMSVIIQGISSLKSVLNQIHTSEEIILILLLMLILLSHKQYQEIILISELYRDKKQLELIQDLRMEKKLNQLDQEWLNYLLIKIKMEIIQLYSKSKYQLNSQISKDNFSRNFRKYFKLIL